MLSRPGALPRLLAAVGHRSGGGEALPAALQAGATMARLPPALSFDDLSSLLAQVPPGSALSHHVHLPPLHFVHLPVMLCTAVSSSVVCGVAKKRRLTMTSRRSGLAARHGGDRPCPWGTLHKVLL